MSQQVPHPDCEVCTGEAPAASPEPVAWQFQMSRRGHDEPPRWHTCTRKTFEERRDQGLTTRTLYAEPTPNSETEQIDPAVEFFSQLHAGLMDGMPPVTREDMETAGIDVDAMLAEVQGRIETAALVRASTKQRAQIRTLREALEIARTAIDQARGD